MIQKISFYEVWDNFSEDGLGRNADKVIARFSTETSANIFAQNNGNYNQKAHVRKIEFCICDSINEIPKVRTEEKKLQALSKLTDEEKRILGL